MLIVLSIVGIIAVSYWAGWVGSSMYQAGNRLRAAAEAEELAAAEYEHGLRDGFHEGFEQAINAARKVSQNQAVCLRLAERRFVAGGARAHE